MLFKPVYPPVGHQIGHRLAIPANDNGFTIRLQLRQEAGKIGLGLVNIHASHTLMLVYLVQFDNPNQISRSRRGASTPAGRISVFTMLLTGPALSRRDNR